MNIKLADCILTTKVDKKTEIYIRFFISQDGEHFFKLSEAYLKGSSLKYFRLVKFYSDYLLKGP